MIVEHYRPALRVFLSLLAAVALMSQVALAQSNQCRLSGRIFDTTQSALPNVALKVTNEATGVVNQTQSNEVGLYVFPSLMPGIYTIERKPRVSRIQARRNPSGDRPAAHPELHPGIGQPVPRPLR